MRLHAVIIAALVLGFARMGYAAQTDVETETFIKNTAISNTGELELGKWAQDRVFNQDTRSYVNKLMASHNKLEGGLMQLAASLNIVLPVQTQLPAEQQAIRDQLTKLSGIKFDRLLVKHMIEVQNGYQTSFERENAETDNPGVKAFTALYLPAFKDQLAAGRDLDDRLSRLALAPEPMGMLPETSELTSFTGSCGNGCGVQAECGCPVKTSCEEKCEENICRGPCDPMEPVMYENDYRDGFTHQIHEHGNNNNE